MYANPQPRCARGGCVNNRGCAIGGWLGYSIATLAIGVIGDCLIQQYNIYGVLNIYDVRPGA